MGPGRDERWLAVGCSSLSDSYRAGVEAAGTALIRDDPKLVVVFCADRRDIPALLRGINATTGGVPLIGCSTSGELSTDGPADGGVVVTVLGGPGFRVATRGVADVIGRQREAGEKVAECAAELGEARHRILLILADGLIRRQQEIIRGAYGVLGASVPLVGALAGDQDLRQERTWVMCGDEVLRDGVVAAALDSVAPFGIGVHHGWRKVGQPTLVTKSVDDRVYLLDDEPAVDVYLRRSNAPREAWTDPATFTQFTLVHPLSVSRRGGEEMRFVVEADFSDGSLLCSADVPQGGMVWMTEGDRNSVLGATDGACLAALEGLGGLPPIGLLAFDCASRRAVLGQDGLVEEVNRIVSHATGTPVAGFYTFGEIARLRGINGLHNKTLVVLAVS